MYLLDVDPIAVRVFHFHCYHQVVVQIALGYFSVVGPHQLVEVDCISYVIRSVPHVRFHQLVEPDCFLSYFSGVARVSEEGREGYVEHLGVIRSRGLREVDPDFAPSLSGCLVYNCY